MAVRTTTTEARRFFPVSSSPQSPPRLTLDRVEKAYGRTPVLNQISLDVAPGETLCLLGSSGCGKTTTLLVTAGIERIGAGRILCDGVVFDDSARSFVPPERRGIGLIFQDYALFPHLTALGNVAFGLKGADKKDRARAELARLRLDDKARAYPHMLSGGEQQRVALARALVRDPSVLLMDEPFSSLDRMLRETLREETRAILRARGTTCLLVTHDPQEAMLMGDRIALMRGGQIVQIGSPLDLYERPVDAAAARFFGRINVIESRVENARVQAGALDLPAPNLPEGTPVQICIRPEGLIFDSPDSGAPGWEARIEEISALGSESLIRLTGPCQNRLNENGSLIARIARTSARHNQLQPGAHAHLRVDPDCVFVFPLETC